MKKVIYSARLDNLFDNISSKNVDVNGLKVYEGDLNKIKKLQHQENKLIEKLTNSPEFIKKMKSKGFTGDVNQISDIALGFISKFGLKKTEAEEKDKKDGFKEKREISRMILQSLNTKMKTNIKLNFDINKIMEENRIIKESPIKNKKSNQNVLSLEDHENKNNNMSKQRRKGIMIDSEILNDPIYTTKGKPLNLLDLKKREVMEKIDKIIDIIDQEEGFINDKLELNNINKNRRQSVFFNPIKKHFKTEFITKKKLRKDKYSSNQTYFTSYNGRIKSQIHLKNEKIMNTTKNLTEMYTNETTANSNRNNFTEIDRMKTESSLKSSITRPTNSNDNANTPLYKQNKIKIVSKNYSSMTGFSSKDNQKKSSKTNEIKFTKTEKINNYMIRDFKISESSNTYQSSRKKIELTQKFFWEKEEKKILEHINEMKEFEQKTGNKCYIDQIFNSTEHSFISKDIPDEELENFKILGKEYNKKLEIKAFDESKKLVEMIEGMNNHKYTKVKRNLKSIKELINQNNLSRVIRLRNILKNKQDPRDENLGMNNLKKFKEASQKIDENISKSLKQLGPPSFLKTKFKNSTMETYKIVNGKYFGCRV